MKNEKIYKTSQDSVSWAIFLKDDFELRVIQHQSWNEKYLNELCLETIEIKK